eukprot:scaffold9517_cov200-Amphora_coffeaeformis.AAC.1
MTTYLEDQNDVAYQEKQTNVGYNDEQNNVEKDTDEDTFPVNVKTKVPLPSYYLLNQPFYIYEEFLMLNATVGGETIEQMIQRNHAWKHTDDVWFIHAALSHPMRTRNPAEAVLFVVPSFTNMFLWTEYRVCVGDDLCGVDYLKKMDYLLGTSPWFQRKQGADHVVVASSFSASWKIGHLQNIVGCNMIAFENRKWNQAERHSMPSYYVGTPCLPREKKYDFAMIAQIKVAESFESRRNICQWIAQERPQYSMPVCGMGEQCPGLAQARFGFHVRGDSYGANRLMDTILSGTVPIFTMKEQYDILPDWIRWDDFSYFADVNDKDNFLHTLDSIIRDTELYEQKLAAVMVNRELFDWTKNVPFDTYMYMLMAEIYPQYQRPPSDSPYSALELSKPGGFDVFDPEKKKVWCGISGPAQTCGECQPYNGSMERGCRRMCHWCEFGYSEESNKIMVAPKPEAVCVPTLAVCKEPSLPALLESTVQPYKPIPKDFEWCLDEDKDNQRVRGLLLAKTFKTGSTSAAGITLQIANRVGKRKQYSRHCLSEHHHNLSVSNRISQRDRDASIVWTVVREPKSRALSSFAFYEAGKQRIEPSDENLIQSLMNSKNNQISQLRTLRPRLRGQNPPGGQDVPESPTHMVHILKGEIQSFYNFIAITERMDESLVVMKILWNLQFGDIIVPSTKQASGWSYDWSKPESCFHIPKVEPSQAVQEFLNANFTVNNYDVALYAFAEASLDKTIDVLGRNRVQVEVERYRSLKDSALRHCRDQIIEPCSDTGEWQPDAVENCLVDDIGCGYQCINDFLDGYYSETS